MRSNKRNLLGFLKEKNRLVVGTSREKCAFYIVGNAKFLEENSPVLWKVFFHGVGAYIVNCRHCMHMCFIPCYIVMGKVLGAIAPSFSLYLNVTLP